MPNHYISFDEKDGLIRCKAYNMENPDTLIPKLDYFSLYETNQKMVIQYHSQPKTENMCNYDNTPIYEYKCDSSMKYPALIDSQMAKEFTAYLQMDQGKVILGFKHDQHYQPV